MVGIKYTQAEIDSSLNKLSNRLHSLDLEKKQLNQEVRDIKNNIKFYEELDCSQLKAF